MRAAHFERADHVQVDVCHVEIMRDGEGDGAVHGPWVHGPWLGSRALSLFTRLRGGTPPVTRETRVPSRAPRARARTSDTDVASKCLVVLHTAHGFR